MHPARIVNYSLASAHSVAVAFINLVGSPAFLRDMIRCTLHLNVLLQVQAHHCILYDLVGWTSLTTRRQQHW